VVDKKKKMVRQFYDQIMYSLWVIFETRVWNLSFTLKKIWYLVATKKINKVFKCDILKLPGIYYGAIIQPFIFTLYFSLRFSTWN